MQNASIMALRVSIICFFVSVVLNLCVLYALLVQIDSTAGLAHRVEKLESNRTNLGEIK